MSENSSKSMPPESDELKESKENSSKGVKTNAENSSGNPKFSKSELDHANPTVSNSSGTPSIPFTQKFESHDKITYQIPKKTQNLYSMHENDPEVDYDDKVVDIFVDTFDTKSSLTILSSSPKANNHLKKGDDKNKSRSEPEKTELNSGPEKADSDAVSKSPESKRKRKEHEIRTCEARNKLKPIGYQTLEVIPLLTLPHPSK